MPLKYGSRSGENAWQQRTKLYMSHLLFSLLSSITFLRTALSKNYSPNPAIGFNFFHSPCLCYLTLLFITCYLSLFSSKRPWCRCLWHLQQPPINPDCSLTRHKASLMSLSRLQIKTVTPEVCATGFTYDGLLRPILLYCDANDGMQEGFLQPLKLMEVVLLLF